MNGRDRSLSLFDILSIDAQTFTHHPEKQRSIFRAILSAAPVT